MELNPQENMEVHSMLVKYCKQLGLKQIPVMTFSKDEIRMVTDPKRLRNMEKFDHERILGQASRGDFYKSHDVIYINIKQMTELHGRHSLKETGRKAIYRRNGLYRGDRITFTKIGHIEETLIHELIHIRFPRLNHGWGFESKIKAVFNGRRYPKIENITYTCNH